MAAMENEVSERLISLPQLQNLMKRDPKAYVSEFDQQWAHFESMMDIFKLRPQKPQQSFGEQVMFLAHVSPSFPDKGAKYPEILIKTLDEHFDVMHSSMRQTLVQALIMLRNRDQFPPLRTLPLYFKLFKLQDKGLRKMVFSHVTRDVASVSTKNRAHAVAKELRDFFFERMKETELEVSRRACAIFISMYRQNVWRDVHVVNLMSAGLLHPDVKISAALAHLYLGNKTKGLEGILEESDDEDEAEDENEAVMGIVGAKKTGNRQKRVARAKKAAKKAMKRKHKGENNAVSCVAIDMLNDPQTLSDRLLQRLSKSGEPFLFRLLLLHLLARLIGRHELQVLNLYPFLIKYLNPNQQHVTKVLACLVEASHPQVPPVELRPVILHIIQMFVTEAQAPEVIEVGLNAIREVCARAVNILTEDELADLVGFRKFKHKGVSMAVRSLINTYRELHPELLHRSLRGREAAIALRQGELQAPQFGEAKVAKGIEGLDDLVARKAKKEGEDADAEKLAALEKLAVETVLSADDFKKIRKLKLQKSMLMQMGGKRKRVDELELSSSDDESSEQDDDDDDEAGLDGRLPGAVAAEDLKWRKKKFNKAQRMAHIEKGRTDFKAELIEKAKNRGGGKTNNEKKRNKPMLMAIKSRKTQSKKAKTAKEKLNSMKTHMKTLKMNAKRQKRRR